MKTIILMGLSFGLLALIGYVNKRKRDEKENPKDVYVYRDMYPTEVHSTRNLLNKLLQEVKANKGEFTESQVRELNMLRSMLRVEESGELFDAPTSLYVRQPVMPPSRLRFSEWKRYIRAEMRLIMQAEMPFGKVA